MNNFVEMDLEKQVLPLKTKLRELRADMKTELIAENFSEKKVSKLMD